MPLFVLIRWVDFIDDFRDDFSTVFQSCVVVIVRERVTVRNPETDSNSEFGRPRYGPTNRGSAREDSPGRGPHGLAVVEDGLEQPLLPCGPRAPHGQGVTWHHMIGPKPSFSLLLYLPSLSHFENLRRKISFPVSPLL